MMDRAVVGHHYQQHFRLKCQNNLWRKYSSPQQAAQTGMSLQNSQLQNFHKEATCFSETRNFSLKKHFIDSFFPTRGIH
jgi:hypothetical protein